MWRPLLGLLLASAFVTGCRGDSRSATSAPAEIATAIPAASASPTAPAATVRPPETGLFHRTLRFAGRDRSYRLVVPASILAAGEAVPLLVALHGGFGTGDQLAATTRFDEVAQRERFIVVYPDGVQRTWNGGDCCGLSAATNVDDVAFLAALVDLLRAGLPIDPGRVFAIGHSNGGIMALRLGCERADVFVAVVAVAASLEMPECRPSRGVWLLNIHGDADRNLPLEGGRGERSVAGIDFRSTASTMDTWTDAMRCATPPVERRDGALTITTWGACRDGVTAQLTVIAGADHPWPGARERLAPNLQGVPSSALDATAAAWSFLAGIRG